MGYWIFMLSMTLILPLAMIVFGGMFIKNIPSKINGVFGFRTAMSMKNEETWKFAHVYSGKLMVKFGAVMLAASVGLMAYFFHFGSDVVSYGGIFIEAVQIIVLFAIIFMTGSALKKEFDKDGNRRSAKGEEK